MSNVARCSFPRPPPMVPEQHFFMYAHTCSFVFNLLQYACVSFTCCGLIPLPSFSCRKRSTMSDVWRHTSLATIRLLQYLQGFRYLQGKKYNIRTNKRIKIRLTFIISGPFLVIRISNKLSPYNPTASSGAHVVTPIQHVVPTLQLRTYPNLRVRHSK